MASSKPYTHRPSKPGSKNLILAAAAKAGKRAGK